jgi:hypothetical protein
MKEFALIFTLVITSFRMYCQNLNCPEEYLKIDSTVTHFGKMTEEENELLFGGSTIFLGVQPGKLEDE